MTLEPPFVKSTRVGAILRLALNRPAQRNALSLAMLGALQTEIAASQDDPGVHVIVLAAEGPVFCAGHDLKELTAARANADGGRAFFEETFALCANLMMAIARSRQPVIAEVQGMATAAGCQLVASCDLAVAADTARFATPGVDIGLFCTTPAVALTRAVAKKAAMEMLLTGEPISAADAKAAGLINQSVHAIELTATTMALAKHISDKPASVIALGKRAVQNQMSLPLGEAYRAASQVMVNNLGYREAREGIAKFLQPKAAKPT